MGNKQLGDALEQQIRLKDDIDTFNESTKESVKKNNKQLHYLMKGKKIFMLLKGAYFQKESKEKDLVFQIKQLTQLKVSDHKLSDSKQLKILTPKQMLQRLPVALAQVKTDNTSANLLNKVRKFI